MLKKVAVGGGPPLEVTQPRWPEPPEHVGRRRHHHRGVGRAVPRAYSRFPPAGGEPMVLTRPNREQGEADHLWPQFLPGGQAVLFTITALTGGVDAAQVAVLDVATGTMEDADSARRARRSTCGAVALCMSRAARCGQSGST